LTRPTRRQRLRVSALRREGQREDNNHDSRGGQSSALPEALHFQPWLPVHTRARSGRVTSVVVYRTCDVDRIAGRFAGQSRPQECCQTRRRMESCYFCDYFQLSSE
jgi:hypothetical protein